MSFRRMIRSTSTNVARKCCLSEPEPSSRPAVSGCGVADRSAGARAYLGPRPLWPVTRWLMGRPAGDDSGRSVFLGAPPAWGGTRDTFGSWPEALGSSQG
jgi:hypothetical protein